MSRLDYETFDERLQYAGKIVSIDNSGYVDIAFPISQCSVREGLTHLMLLITAAAEYNYTETFWIESIELPREFVHRYRGPRFGKDGIRDIFQIYKRPLIGLIVKPRNGVSLNSIIRVCEEALRGGADFIVDDLLMVDPDGEMEFANRIERLAELTQRMTQATGEQKRYFANVGFTAHKAAENALYAANVGVGGVLVNAFTMGLGGVEHVVDSLDGRIPVISTNMGSGIMTRGTWLGSAAMLPTGMSEAVIAKLARVAGADAVHTGTSASECYGEDAWGPASRSLSQQLHGIAPGMSIAEGDLTVANLWDNIRSLGRDLLVEPTSGIINFPGGPAKGAEAFRLLAEVLLPEMSPKVADESIQKVAKRYAFVKQGLREFGYKGYDSTYRNIK
jgi:2,3-diketo-5-methylthiopentyl-1-phosphate enolase